MTLTELQVDQLGIINYIDTQEHNMEDLYGFMRLGVVPGLEIRKLSAISSCAEYRIEGCCARLAISNDLADYIMIDVIDETEEN